MIKEQAIIEKQLSILIDNYGEDAVVSTLNNMCGLKFKNSPLHDKQAIINMLDNFSVKQMSDTVDFIQTLASNEYSV